MTKKELIEMLSKVPDNARILTTYDTYDLLGTNPMTHTHEINGFYEFKGSYVLSAANVRPYIIKESND